MDLVTDSVDFRSWLRVNRNDLGAWAEILDRAAHKLCRVTRPYLEINVRPALSEKAIKADGV